MIETKTASASAINNARHHKKNLKGRAFMLSG
jgi:hypothetical protein